MQEPETSYNSKWQKVRVKVSKGRTQYNSKTDKTSKEGMSRVALEDEQFKGFPWGLTPSSSTPGGRVCTLKLNELSETDRAQKKAGPSAFGGVDSRPNNFARVSKRKKPRKVDTRTLNALDRQTKALQ